MALAEPRENKVPGEDLSGEQVDKMKLSVILTQREEWGRGGGRGERKWRYCHNSCVSAWLLGAQVVERLPRPGLINVKGDLILSASLPSSA